MSTMASRRPRDTMSRSTHELRERLQKMGPKGNAAALQIAELAGTLPGWRWIEDEVVDGDETTRYVHLWVRLAAGVGPADVTFRAKKGATNAIHLACGRDVVFDDRFRLMSDVDGGDAEWTVEGDAKRGGAPSVHITLTRCKSVGYIPWPRPFRNQSALDPDLAVFRKPCFGDGAPPPPKPPPKAKPARRRRAKQSTTVVCATELVAPLRQRGWLMNALFFANFLFFGAVNVVAALLEAAAALPRPRAVSR